MSASDVSDPRVWWRKLVDAVIGLQRGDKTKATEYLQFVQEHRGRDVALQARSRLPVLAKSEAFSDCRRWPANGYRPTERPRKK